MTGLRGYAVCTSGRSGSNWLCELLTSTGVLGNPLEYFNVEARRRRTDPDYPDDPAEQLARIVTTGATPNGVYGVKVFPSHLDALAGRVRWADALPNLRFVELRRRDVLGQAISLTRSEQTGRFRSTEHESVAPQYDGEAIAANLRFFARDQARWAAYFARNGIAPLRLTYERVVDEPQRAIDAVAALVGIPDARIVPALVEQRVMHDALTHAWRERFCAEYADPNVMDAI